MSNAFVQQEAVQKLLREGAGLNVPGGNKRFKAIVHRLLENICTLIDDYNVTEEEFWHAVNYLHELGGSQEAALLAAGLEAALQEEFSRRLIRVTDARIIGGYQTLDEVKPQVRRMLPAHLEVEFDIGILTWEMFEGFGLDFAAWDRRDFTWEWFDLNGDKLGGE